MKQEKFGGFILEIGEEEIFLHYKRTFDDYLAHFLWTFPILIGIGWTVYAFWWFWTQEDFSFFLLFMAIVLLFANYASIKYAIRSLNKPRKNLIYADKNVGILSLKTPKGKSTHKLKDVQRIEYKLEERTIEIADGYPVPFKVVVIYLRFKSRPRIKFFTLTETSLTEYKNMNIDQDLFDLAQRLCNRLGQVLNIKSKEL
ncbi:MAG: hypothetical protein AAF696_32835 [Bacteroidota bacterium]